MSKKQKIDWFKIKNEQDKEFLRKRIDRLMRVKFIINEELFALNVDLKEIDNRRDNAKRN